MKDNEDWKQEVVFGTFERFGVQILCAYHPKSNLKVFVQIERSQHNAKICCFDLLSKQLENLPPEFKAPEVKPAVITTLVFSE